MNFKILKNDFKRNLVGNIALLLFMIMASGLVVIATVVVTQLMTSMRTMYDTAKPPHFLQMHKGEMNQEAIDEFASNYEGVTAWQTVPMIDVYGDDLTVLSQKDSYRLSECRLDISLVTQNKEYDLLLDKDRNVLKIHNGEIGIPVILLDAYDIKIGDTLVLSTKGVVKKFKVTEFVFDAQMNSTLCSSTRMLISNDDFAELFEKVGETEYLIEMYFTDKSISTEFQTAYEKAGLPQNGQAVTYTIIFLLSALRDIMMAMILIFVSVLLVIVALMCIKYTVMAALEEEISEIGTMKAIGISYKDIRNLYLMKYKWMVAIGIITGYCIAIIISRIFTEHVSDTFGKQPRSVLSIVIPMVTCLLVYVVSTHYCKKILKKLKKLTVVETLITRNGFGKGSSVKDGLHKSKTMPVDLLVSLREIFYSFHGFIIVFVVMLIVSGIIIAPMNLLNTMKAKEFINYMGSSMDDLLIELEPGQDLENRYDAVTILLKEDSDIHQYKEFKRVLVEAKSTEDEWRNIHIDCGKEAGKELKYLEGNAPSMEYEIAFSKLNSDALGKQTGDSILIKCNGVLINFTISGVYQDVTSGGFTAKSIYEFSGLKAEQYQYTVSLVKGASPSDKAHQWSKRLGGGYDIEPMEEFINQTLGGVIRQVEIATAAVIVIGVALAALIIILFMKLRMAKDIAQVAAMKAIGFTNSDVRRQYLYKIGIVSFLGIIVGTIFSGVLGESIVSMAFSMMNLGISNITFIINPWIEFLLLPAILLAVTALVTWVSTRQIREYHIISLINE